MAAASAFCTVLNAAIATPGWPISRPPKISCNIGEATPMMPIEAETFSSSTPQISQNCGVLWALSR